MPHFYFHTENGDCIRDDQGEDLPDVDTAREEAVAVLGGFCGTRGAAFWETASFSVIVTDADGRTVVSVTAKASDAPPEGWVET
ncbi:DUF6894 family protein [Brevundimonas sp. SL130]|uniref:DUF6894 family protein n=1 Tax=Brevundimonas sp. SL130 TaxID=2995143 RepID=UPI00226D1F89|nr:hypothetical protein [Brevundimonas sp. SL130]WAC60322.1 hypothetical protein OU998_02405 [Brevundimonas sp. SL130]